MLAVPRATDNVLPFAYSADGDAFAVDPIAGAATRCAGELARLAEEGLTHLGHLGFAGMSISLRLVANDAKQAHTLAAEMRGRCVPIAPAPSALRTELCVTHTETDVHFLYVKCSLRRPGGGR